MTLESSIVNAFTNLKIKLLSTKYIKSKLIDYNLKGVKWG